ncbi:MAG: hypothetical protein K6G01_05330 [Eubacterium sp.]|nr:hypothetical protein [Eubacterium sp.]
MAKQSSQGMEILIAVYTTPAADSLCGELAAESLHYLRRKIGSGNYGGFQMTMRNNGEEILVDAQDMDAAKQIRDKWLETADRFSNSWDRPDKVAEVPGKVDKKALTARVLAAIVLVVMVVWYLATRA